MTDEQIALARRAVACKRWRWMPGMLTADGFRVCRVDADGYKFGYRTEYNYAYAVIGDSLPMIEDPATLGCLLALVREAWDDPYAFVGWFDPHWKVIRCRTESLIGCLAGRGDTEVKALVAALEAAPCGQ